MDMAAHVIDHALSSGSPSIQRWTSGGFQIQAGKPLTLLSFRQFAFQRGRKTAGSCSKRPLLAHHHEAFSLSGACQANIEAHKFQCHGIVIGRDECRCELQTVGSA